MLSVWKTWDIENQTFSSMVMVHGDNCQGNLDRQVKVSKYTLRYISDFVTEALLDLYAVFL